MVLLMPDAGDLKTMSLLNPLFSRAAAVEVL
jgi:hypothetical protein